MIAKWDSSLTVLPVARVQFPARAEYFKGFFPGWSHSANPSWASVAENGSISPQWHHTTCGQRGGRPKSNHGQTMADRKKSAGLLYSTKSMALLPEHITQIRHSYKESPVKLTEKIFPSMRYISRVIINFSNGLRLSSVNPYLVGLWCTDFNILKANGKFLNTLKFVWLVYTWHQTLNNSEICKSYMYS